LLDSMAARNIRSEDHTKPSRDVWVTEAASRSSDMHQIALLLISGAVWAKTDDIATGSIPTA
jgi:hypothetical protein